MKTLACALVVALLAFPAHAAPPVVTPFGVGVTLVQWVLKDRKKVLQVDVVSEGDTLEQAKQQGFRLAVEHAAGVVIASETEVEQDKISRDEVITYSSGYVSDFQIVDQRTVGNKVQISLRVWISSNALSGRLLGRSQDNGVIPGQTASAQIITIQDERAAGSRLLTTVLNDYPRRAFDIVVGKPQVTLTPLRQAQLEIPFTVSWNQKYVASLGEALRQTTHRSNCNNWFSRCRYTSVVAVSGQAIGYYDDTIAYDLVHAAMILSNPRIQVTIKSLHNSVYFKRCFSVPEIDHSAYSPWKYIDIGGYEAVLHPSKNKQFNMALPITAGQIENLGTVEIEVVRGNRC